MKPYMSEQELKFRYKNMSDVEDKVTVLAELNGCSVQSIEMLLFGEERTPRTIDKKTRKDREEMMYRMYLLGCDDTYIANKVGMKRKAAFKWRKRNNLPTKIGFGGGAKEMYSTWDLIFGEYDTTTMAL